MDGKGEELLKMRFEGEGRTGTMLMSQHETLLH